MPAYGTKTSANDDRDTTMAEMSRIAGVLGGLGPAATVDFMQRVIDLTPAQREQDHVHLLVDQNPAVPNRQDAILDDQESPAPELAKMASRLEKAGADFLVMPCNTAHAFQRDIIEAVTIPFLSIVDATLQNLPATCRRVGILETPACRKAGLYEEALAVSGKARATLSDDECKHLMDIAYRVKSGRLESADQTEIKHLVAALLAQGAEAIIVACTEIPLLLKDEDVDVPLVSTTDALARLTIAIARGETPLPAAR